MHHHGLSLHFAPGWATIWGLAILHFNGIFNVKSSGNIIPFSILRYFFQSIYIPYMQYLCPSLICRICSLLLRMMVMITIECKNLCLGLIGVLERCCEFSLTESSFSSDIVWILSIGFKLVAYIFELCFPICLFSCEVVWDTKMNKKDSRKRHSWYINDTIFLYKFMGSPVCLCQLCREV